MLDSALCCFVKYKKCKIFKSSSEKISWFLKANQTRLRQGQVQEFGICMDFKLLLWTEDDS